VGKPTQAFFSRSSQTHLTHFLASPYTPGLAQKAYIAAKSATPKAMLAFGLGCRRTVCAD
jgi:hypothetical protein